MHNIDTQRIPQGVTHVPTLVTQDEVIIGGKIKKWFDKYCNQTVPAAHGGGIHFLDLDGSSTASVPGGPTNLMDLDMPLAAPMTEEHKRKMQQEVK